jgi:signal transduction histidine kinase
MQGDPFPFDTSRHRPVAPACWQFDITDARPLLAAGLSGPEAEWGQDGLERILARVRIVTASDAALRLFDLPSDHRCALARPIGSLWPVASLGALAELLASLADSGAGRIATREIGRLDRWADMVLTGWRSADPRCPEMIFVSVQATLDPRGALLELEASQQRYRSLISSLPVPLWDVDARAVGRIFDRLRADGLTDLDDYLTRHPDLVDLACDIAVVTEANRDAALLMGAADASELVRPVSYLFAMAPEARRRVMLAHFSGQRNHVEQARIRTFDGRIRDVLLLVTFPVPGEQLDSTLVMMIDNTARLETEARLCQIEADFSHAARLSTLGQMTASIAHEVKQPLSAILTSAETSLRWLAREDPNLPKVTQLCERIAASAHRASDIIARIQDMAGKRTPRHIRLDLNEVISEALTFVRHDSEERSIRLRLDLAEDLPPVTGERIQLQQVVVNLLINSAQALEATAPDRREIRVATFRQGPGSAGFSIADSGPGIPQDDLAHIFGGFFSTKDGGMGIGLTICQSIIAGHGGTISAANRPGGGAEFKVVLPLEPPALAPAGLDQGEPAPSRAPWPAQRQPAFEARLQSELR